MMQSFKHNRIMLVDDEEFCIAFMKGMIEKAGIDLRQVDSCISGVEAIELLK